MNVLVFGATGMLGQAVVGECLRDASVTRVVIVGRRPTGLTDAKIVEIVESDIARREPIRRSAAARCGLA